jgi:MFS-type transporter involved in bile tolerance (Atg22 family)
MLSISILISLIGLILTKICVRAYYKNKKKYFIAVFIITAIITLLSLGYIAATLTLIGGVD